MIFHDSTKKKVFQNIQNKVVFKNLDDSGVISSDFPGPRTSAASLTSSAYATSLASYSLKSPISPKNFLILMIGSPLAPKWPILAPFCGMDLKKSNFSLLLGTLSVGSSWGQLMLLFKKMVVVAKIPYLSTPEPIHNVQFNMRYPLHTKLLEGFICTFSLSISISITLRTSKFRNQFTNQLKIFWTCKFRCHFAEPQKR